MKKWEPQFESLIKTNSCKKIFDYYGSSALSNSYHLSNESDTKSLLPHPIPSENLNILIPMSYKSFSTSSITSKLAYQRSINHRSALACMTFAHDGSRLYLGSKKGEIYEWLVNKGFPHPQEKLEIRIVTTDSKSIHCLRFMRDGNHLLTGDEDGNVIIYRSNIEKILAVKAHVSDGHISNTYTVTSVAPSPTNFMFCSASEDSTLKIWDLGKISMDRNQRKALRNYVGHNNAVLTVDWNSTRGLIASGSKDNTIRLWDPRSKYCIGIIHEHNSRVNSLQFNQNTNWLLSTSEDQSCRIFDIRTNKEMQRFTEHNSPVSCAAWHPIHQDLFASGSKDGELLHWIVGYNKPLTKRIQKHETNICAMAWHPVGNLLATGSGNSNVKFWVRARPAEIFSCLKVPKDKMKRQSIYKSSEKTAFPGL